MIVFMVEWHEASERQGIKGKRLKAAYNPNYLCKVLGKKG
jgi:hypothetical protein